jgi:hypothetical protein
MMLFQGRDAGVMILIKMIQMAAQQSGAAPLGISYSGLAIASACRAPMSASFWSRRKRWVLFV